MLPIELRTAAAFRDAFNTGLRQLLDTDGLGVTILLLANAANDPAVWREFEPALKARFAELDSRYRQALRRGGSIAETDDDLMVFLKLMVIGFDAVETRTVRNEGPWELQFNPVRSFRPRRMTGQRVDGLSRPFDPDGFHFNRPFLRKEIFWEGELLGRNARLLYNKFPFETLHSILVPGPEENRAQLLTERDHLYVWRLVQAMSENIPGLSAGFNAFGALASVNHLHFQLFVRSRPMPVADARWRHNGGGLDYPLPVWRFGNADEAWRRIQELHEVGMTYNLLYDSGGLWCMPRLHQGHYEAVDWSAGFSFYELAGAFITFAGEEYESLVESTLSKALHQLRVPDQS